ncbi:OmpP1/FadL family transporter [Chromobacterium sp. IIBBL 290-4]|uniref:OmpP1/FadL family transporter n=1 Tax=Chromobacterium sp. IIBBL 290-4 TaxID=2953890 RepID=UPI0020B8B4F3|nr:outer membrane protein transport protein [Chromobacterium sp. IIBBL 290-4]UTH74395.1 outer membrane protein transport protein [Chromobacterium sp. IIBBL 290-4]
MQYRFARLSLRVLPLAVSSLFAAQAVQAAGFQLTEQSVAGMGRAYAGAGVAGDDLSAAFYNPAGLTLLSGTRAQAGFTYAEINAPFNGSNTTVSENPITHQPLVSSTASASDNGRAPGEAIPNAYFTHQISDKLYAGLGLTTPFGLGARYNENWGGRDNGISSSIQTLDINPSLAYKLDDRWSFGGGVSAQYAKADLKKGAYLPGASGELKADSWGFGYNLGVMYSASADTRFGLSYRSKIHHQAEGDYTNAGFQDLTVPTGIKAMPLLNVKLSQLNGTFGGSADVTAPESLLLSAYSKLNNKFAVAATARWTHWSSFDQLVVKGSPAFKQLGMSVDTTTTIDNHWKNSWMFSVGGDYFYSEALTLRSGIGYETTPVPNPQHRNALIPDADRLWLSLGASYKINKQASVDVAYAYLRAVGDTKIDNTSHSPFGTSSRLQGDYSSISGQLIGVQMQYRF